MKMMATSGAETARKRLALGFMVGGEGGFSEFLTVSPALAMGAGTPDA
jgi:hypothetical protein